MTHGSSRITDSLQSFKALNSRRAHDEMRKIHLKDVLTLRSPAQGGNFYSQKLNEAAMAGLPSLPPRTFSGTWSTVRNTIRVERNEEYKLTSLAKHKVFTGIFHDISRKPWFQEISLTTDDVQTLNRLFVNLPYSEGFLARIGWGTSFAGL